MISIPNYLLYVACDKDLNDYCDPNYYLQGYSCLIQDYYCCAK